jgi:hypothetical protein
MKHAQKYLAQANRQIAELTVQLARQRVIVKHALYGYAATREAAMAAIANSWRRE